MSRLGSTRMACPDMTTEQNVLNALGQVKSYKNWVNIIWLFATLPIVR